MIKADKSTFPKVLYLDQNKWIDLSRAHYGKPGGEAFKDAQEALAEAVATGKLIVPMSGIHVMETGDRGDPESRRRLATFLVRMSGNKTILPSLTVRPAEIEHAVRQVLGKDIPYSVRERVLSIGISSTMGSMPVISGIPKEDADLLLAVLVSPEASIEALVNSRSPEYSRESRKIYEEALPELEEIRRRSQLNLTPEMKEKVEFGDLFIKGPPSRELQEVLAELKVPPVDFFKSFASPDDYMRFFRSIPTVNVFVHLMMHRDKDTSRKIDRNDLKDMEFLSVALPHCNLVVCEKYWAEVAKTSGLAAQYGTRVERDVSQLRQYLKDAGVL